MEQGYLARRTAGQVIAVDAGTGAEMDGGEDQGAAVRFR